MTNYEKGTFTHPRALADLRRQMPWLWAIREDWTQQIQCRVRQVHGRDDLHLAMANIGCWYLRFATAPHNPVSERVAKVVADKMWMIQDPATERSIFDVLKLCHFDGYGGPRYGEKLYDVVACIGESDRSNRYIISRCKKMGGMLNLIE